MRVPYQNLYIYLLEGCLNPDQEIDCDNFIGNWKEEGFADNTLLFGRLICLSNAGDQGGPFPYQERITLSTGAIRPAWRFAQRAVKSLSLTPGQAFAGWETK